MTNPRNGALTTRERVEAALALRLKGRFDEALQLLSQPGAFSPDVCTLRGDLHFEVGRLHDAVRNYSTVLAFAGDNVYVQHQFALCLRGLEQWEAAADAFRKLLSYDSHRDNARIGLGECLLRLGRTEEALSCFDACWSESAQAPALFGKAVALQLLRRFEDAESAYERFLAHDPRSEEALSNLVALSVERFDLARVHRYALALLELSPHSRVALQGLTLAALEHGEYDTAARHFAHLARHSWPDDLSQEGTSGRVIRYELPPEASGHLHRIWRDLAERDKTQQPGQMAEGY